MCKSQTIYVWESIPVLDLIIKPIPLAYIPRKDKLALNSILQDIFIACSCKCVGFVDMALLYPENQVLHVHVLLTLEFITILSPLDYQGKNLKPGRSCTCALGNTGDPIFQNYCAQSKQCSPQMSITQHCGTHAIIFSPCASWPTHQE